MAFNWKGIWTNSETYIPLDVVSFNNAMFLCILEHTNQTPVIGTDTDYWANFNLNTSFPGNIDQFITRNPVQASDLTDLQTYQSLSATPSLTPEQQDQLNLLSTKLRDKLLLPVDVNQIQQAIQNLEAFFLNNVNGYISQQTSSFNTILNNFSYKGDWSSATNYQPWNITRYSGNIYFAKQTSLNISPTTGDSADNYWCLLSKKGDKGEPGLSLSYKGEYNNSSPYVVGDAISYDGVIYYCKQDTTGNLPTNGSYWTVFDKIFVGSAPPASPYINQLWLDTGAMILKCYDGTTWNSITIAVMDGGTF